MKKILFVLFVFILTGCGSTYKSMKYNSEGLKDRTLISKLIDEIEEGKEKIKTQKMEMQFEYLRKIQEISLSQKYQDTKQYVKDARDNLINTKCLIFCF